jgi:hypothetical protein
MKKEYSIPPEVMDKVMQDYPVTQKEKKCAQEKRKREALRMERAKRIMNDRPET